MDICRRMLQMSFWTLAVLLLLLMTLASISAQVLRKDAETSLRLVPTSNNYRPRTCNVDCSMEPTQFVCATDGRTYNNRCELQRVNCDQSGATAAVQVKHVGRCHEKYRCRSERAHAQEVLARGAAGNDPQSTANLFEPKCREDGSYAAVQCHSATGYCWCVTPNGRPVRGSSVRNRRPYCKKRAAILGKNGNKRSSVRRGGPSQRKQVNNRQGCNQADKLLFKKNLVKIFVSEYARMTSLSMMPGTGVVAATTANPVLNSAEKKAADWKFTELDKNGNNFLDKKEVKSLRRMVKKIVKPRECAKRFTKFCDLDRSGRISRNEWTVCFGMGMNKEQTVVSGVGQTGSDGSDDEDEDEDDDDDLSHGIGHHQEQQQQHHQHQAIGDMEGGQVGQLPSSSAPRNKQMTLTEDDKVGDLDEEADDEEDEDMDCQTERRSALEQQRATQDSLYIPECGPNDDDGHGGGTGRSTYAQVQCYKSTDYCWCVDQLTGKPIPNTSVRYMRPDCERLIRAERPIMGCPEKKKLKFVADFTDFLTKEMNTALNQTQSSSSGPAQQKALVDSLARWKFSNLDSNDNRVLDRKEWRIFRVELKKKNSIRKCGRNFVKFCDEDDDKKITYTEWQECFNVLVERTANTPSRGIKRPSGPNPLITYLKND